MIAFDLVLNNGSDLWGEENKWGKICLDRKKTNVVFLRFVSLGVRVYGECFFVDDIALLSGLWPGGPVGNSDV